MKPQFLIGGATSGSGKTVFALGLLRALKKRGIKVQPYKCGPGLWIHNCTPYHQEQTL